MSGRQYLCEKVVVLNRKFQLANGHLEFGTNILWQRDHA